MSGTHILETRVAALEEQLEVTTRILEKQAEILDQTTKSLSYVTSLIADRDTEL